MDQNQQTWMQRAEDYSRKKMMSNEYFQALGLLAIAEALQRVAQAMESAPRQQ